jgi:hypothetical protein
MTLWNLIILTTPASWNEGNHGTKTEDLRYLFSLFVFRLEIVVVLLLLCRVQLLKLFQLRLGDFLPVGVVRWQALKRVKKPPLLHVIVEGKGKK